MTTLMQYRRLVRSRLGIPIADDFFDDSTLDDNINLALASLTAETRWPWNERTGTVTVADAIGWFPLPPNWAATRSLFSGDREVQLVAPTDLERWPETAGAGGPPMVWSPAWDRISFRPASGGDLIHSWYVDEVWQLNDDDQPNLPDRYASAVIAKACELLSQREGDRQQAAVHLAEYAGWLTRMRKDTRTSTGPVIPRVRPGSQITV